MCLDCSLFVFFYCRYNQWDGVYGSVYKWDTFKTIVTEIKLEGKCSRILHATQNRTLSLRELARAQGFPDTYCFGFGPQNKLFDNGNTQIGNAVPPPLAKAVGHKIAESLAQMIEL